MEIIYVYIEKLDSRGEIKINFSPKFNCNFRNGDLSIEERKYSEIENYYGNINSLNLILGKNGCGKTTLFNFIFKNDELFSGFILYNHDGKFVIDRRDIVVNCDGISDINDELSILYLPNSEVDKSKSKFLSNKYIKKENSLLSLYNFFTSNILEEKLYIKLNKVRINIPKHKYLNYMDLPINSLEPKELLLVWYLSQKICTDRNKKEVLSFLSRMELDENTLPSDIIRNFKEFYKISYENYYTSGFIKENNFNESILEFINFYNENEILDIYEKLFNSIINNVVTVNMTNITINDIKFIELITNCKYNYEFINLSSGEYSLISILSNVYTSLLTVKTENIVLLFDEIEKNLHPEWSRKIVSYITNMFYSIEKYNSIHIYISTHNPILVSDFFKERIVKLINDNGCIRQVESKYGILSNISEVMIDDFFLDVPFGEFARKKFKRYYNEIATGNYNEKEVEKFIESISDISIKIKIQEHYENNKSNLDKVEYFKTKINEYTEKLKEAENDKD